MQKNMMDILRTKAMLDFAFFFHFPSFPMEAKNASSICPALEGSILIRNDSLTSEESKAKNHL